MPNPEQFAELYLRLQAEFGKDSPHRPTLHQIVRTAWVARKNAEVTLEQLKNWVHAMNVGLSERKKADEGGRK